jgi:hypothetical protein
MRRIPLLAAALLLLSTPSFAEDWIEYTSKADFFSVNFPGEPTVREITFMSEYGAALPGRVYSHDNGPYRYSVTVVDYADVEKKHKERAKGCEGEEVRCQDNWREDIRGAIVFATFKFLQRDAKVTHYSWYVSDHIDGHRLQLTNADRSRTFAVIHMHENRLYILEGTVPAGWPEPLLFQQSLGFFDKDMKRVRYQWRGLETYSSGFPPPPRER